jgi:hypothetical protein
MSARLSGPSGHIPRWTPAPSLNCANATPHDIAAAALDHDGLTQGLVRRNAALGAAKRLLRTPIRCAALSPEITVGGRLPPWAVAWPAAASGWPLSPPCARAAAPVSAGACRPAPRRCPGSCAASVTSGQPVTGVAYPPVASAQMYRRLTGIVIRSHVLPGSKRTSQTRRALTAAGTEDDRS